MKLGQLLPTYLVVDRPKALLAAALLVVAIAFADWRATDLSLAFLYLFPILIASPYLTTWQIVGLSLLCASLRDAFGPFGRDLDIVPRFLMATVTFAATGLLVSELDHNRKAAVAHLERIRSEVQMREAAQEQLRGLIESSPAAILTVGGEGKVLLANEAAHALLGCASGTLPGDSIDSYLPIFANLRRTQRASRSIRTMMESTGRRRGGQAFLAHVWLSSYECGGGRQTAAIIFDASEQRRDSEEQGLHQLLTHSRIVMGAVWHELRNLSGAARVVLGNLERVPGLKGIEDFKALGTLVVGLEKMASAELHPAARFTAENVDLSSVVAELRVLSEPMLEESGVEAEWNLPGDLPLVRADHQGLVQVFLNLVNNAREAAAQLDQPRQFSLSASVEGRRVMVRFRNSGPAVSNPEALFQPFQVGAGDVGLGLYVSRAMMRSFAGDLRYEPAARGCCFAAVLESAPQ